MDGITIPLVFATFLAVFAVFVLSAFSWYKRMNIRKAHNTEGGSMGRGTGELVSVYRPKVWKLSWVCKHYGLRLKVWENSKKQENGWRAAFVPSMTYESEYGTEDLLGYGDNRYEAVDNLCVRLSGDVHTVTDTTQTVPGDFFDEYVERHVDFPRVENDVMVLVQPHTLHPTCFYVCTAGVEEIVEFVDKAVLNVSPDEVEVWRVRAVLGGVERVVSVRNVRPADPIKDWGVKQDDGAFEMRMFELEEGDMVLVSTTDVATGNTQTARIPTGMVDPSCRIPIMPVREWKRAWGTLDCVEGRK